jgi:KamA family protein
MAAAHCIFSTTFTGKQPMPDQQVTPKLQENRRMQSHSCRSLGELLSFLGLDRKAAPYRLLETIGFPLAVPTSFLCRMQKGEWYDPLLLQVLPRAEEAMQKRGFTGDPVGDAASEVVPGLLHKYASRALLLASNQCAMHCRFCFRREQAVGTIVDLEKVTDYLSRHDEINEVVLSGGDPFCLSAEKLSEIVSLIASIGHISTIRIHTRLPVAMPELIDEQMIGLVAGIAAIKTCVVVVHANHAAELAGDASLCLSRLRFTGALLLNQTVLLKGVLPYYLHQLDRVAGAWHFEVDEGRGKALMRELRLRLPGYAVPRYVREVAGEKAKRLL